jgi:DNA replication and repair protein RecF
VLFVKSLGLVQFRNYLQQRFDFTERIIGICGRNGTGKTNLLDAIHYLSLTKSYFSRPDSQSVTQGMQGLRIEAEFDLLSQSNKIVCILRENNKKEFLVNNETYKRLSEHIGKFPCVMIAPDDVELISGGSEERRNFIDTILCQLDKDYLQQLISYNKILQQRNSFLKNIAESPASMNEPLLETLNEQLNSKGQLIFNHRKIFMQDFLPLVIHHYQKIAGKADDLSLVYESQLFSGEMKDLLKATLQKDLALQRTNVGIHKDDLDIYIQTNPFKSIASQGQRKSLLFALKLAEWDVLKEKKGFTPVLLLDDVFEKLDEQRMHNLLHWVCAENEGQVFITDTHKERLTQQLKDIKVNFQIIQLP